MRIEHVTLVMQLFIIGMLVGSTWFATKNYRKLLGLIHMQQDMILALSTQIKNLAARLDMLETENDGRNAQ